MSLFTFLASCVGARTEAAKATVAEHPRFPETDAAGVTFEHIVLPDGFSMKTFFIAPDKQSLYALAYKDFGTRIPDDPRPAERTDIRVYELDTKGVAKRHLELRNTADVYGSSVGMIGDELMMYTGDQFVVINTTTLTSKETIPVWHEQHFPTKQNIELMTRDEYIPAYEKLFDAALKDCTHCHWLVWPSGKYFVYVSGPPGKRAMWSPLTYEDHIIDPLKKRFPTITVAENVRAGTNGGGFMVTDGAVTIHEEDILDGGRELDYPNYKDRSIVQYAMTIGSRILHFSTTDRKRQDARIGFADNAYLTTADGAVWVRYMGWLYRFASAPVPPSPPPAPR